MTPFARKVYSVVARIPIGQVRSYQWVARQAGRPRAWRAVGQILKRNPYPFIIPCHRVVKNDQSLGGYVFGAKAKRSLLELERRVVQCLQSKR